MTITGFSSRTMIMAAIILAGAFLVAPSESAIAVDPAQDNPDTSKPMKKTDSGLAYFDEKEGTGEPPKPGQLCFVHYTGWLWENKTKGKKFDSSKDRNAPFPFRVGKGQVIKGWDEGVATMKVGGKRELLVPAELGYGERGAGGVIPPNATLFFEVELLGVMKQTRSGLEYRDLKVGDGLTPKSGQTCVVHYTGWLWEDGKGRMFDSSVRRGEPISFPVGQHRVIAGWDEGLSTMKVGGKRELLIPSHLAYGPEGRRGVIPPNAALLFEVELLDVK